MANRLAQDVRYGVRTLARAPGFTAIALVVLSLGIGANATIFSFANAFFLRPLPVSNPGSVVRVCSNRYSTTRQRSYLEYRDRNSTLSGLAAFQLKSFGLLIDRETEHVFGEIVSGEYFSTVGIAPARGRLLQPSDDRSGASPVVVLWYAFWTRRFGAAPDAIGKTIRLNDQPFQVVGVAAQDFAGLMTPLRGDLWVPLAADAYLRPALDAEARLDSTSLHLVGRLKPDVNRARAQTDLDTIGRQLRTAAGQPDSGPAVSVYSGTTLHPEIAPPVTAFTAVLMAVVGLVLLIVCVNLANLVLARAAGRSSGARNPTGTRRRAWAAAASVADRELAAVECRRCRRHRHRVLVDAPPRSGPAPAPVPLALDLAIDVRVLAFTTLVAVMTSLAFGLAPALTASRVDLVAAIKGSAGEGRGHGRLRSGFLVAQVSMSVLLLIAAGLFIRGFRNARSFDIGFNTDRVLTASVDLETRGYSEARGREFVRAIVERLGAAPGVVGANALDIVPVTLSNRTGQMIREGDPEPGPDRPPLPNVYLNAVGPGHFRTLRIAMAAGRDFTEQDGASATNVVIVNETLARRYWPESSALGKRLRPIGAPDRVLEVVGVVRDSKYSYGGRRAKAVCLPTARAGVHPARDPSGPDLRDVRRRTTDDQRSRESAGSGPGRLQCRDVGRRDRPGIAAGAGGRQPARGSGNSGASPRRAWHLRSALVHRPVPHARDRCADRDRRHAAGCCFHGGPAIVEVECRRPEHRTHFRGPADAPPPTIPVRDQPDGSVDVRHRHAVTRPRRVRRGDDPGRACQPPRSHRCAKGPVNRSLVRAA